MTPTTGLGDNVHQNTKVGTRKRNGSGWEVMKVQFEIQVQYSNEGGQ